MPELPEVETLCRQLNKKIGGIKILATASYDEKLDGIKKIREALVIGVCRQGKTIRINLVDGHSILIHLRMTGRLLWRQGSDRPRYARWSMMFDNGTVFLVDPRRFATVKVEKAPAGIIRNDLTRGFDKNSFLQQQAIRKTNIKTTLMDQKALAGIGNIYASEILYRAGVLPMRLTSSLSRKEWEKIFHCGRTILKKAVANRGTSISDWHDLHGRKGVNQHELKVYARHGTMCSVCGEIIRRVKQGSRSTFYCPGCQI